MKLKNLLQRFFNEVSDFFEINELLSHLKFNGFKFGVSSEQVMHFPSLVGIEGITIYQSQSVFC